MQLKNDGTDVVAHGYAYDVRNRLATVGNGVHTAHYTRQPGTGLLTQTQIKDASNNVVMTADRTYDQYYRLTGVTSVAGTTTRGYVYEYDDKDRRVKCTMTDGSYWEYAYDEKGQVIGGVKKDAEGHEIFGQSFGYAYDGIGNRTLEKRGIVENEIKYTANELNQYAKREFANVAPLTGEADVDATVKIIRNDTDFIYKKRVTEPARDGKYFKSVFYVDNTKADKTIPFNVYAIRHDEATGKDLVEKKEGSYTVPKALEPFAYDLDGNMLTERDWAYTWDAENRLIAAVNTASTQKLEFAYDYMNRRVSKKVYSKTAEATEWTLAKTEKFAYDGWNMIAVFNAEDALQKSYLWGEDLRGSLQGAGGVGGLLAETSATGNYFPMYNGNGDVMAYVNIGGTVAAEYLYDTFGRTILQTGDLADTFDFRFSTKYLDQETGLYYYGYRYYSADTGKWLSRDPIEETGGVNLYGFVGNNPVSKWDYLGMETKVGPWTLDDRSSSNEYREGCFNQLPPNTTSGKRKITEEDVKKLAQYLMLDSNAAGGKIPWLYVKNDKEQYVQYDSKSAKADGAQQFRVPNTIIFWNADGVSPNFQGAVTEKLTSAGYHVASTGTKNYKDLSGMGSRDFIYAVIMLGHFAAKEWNATYNRPDQVTGYYMAGNKGEEYSKFVGPSELRRNIGHKLAAIAAVGCTTAAGRFGNALASGGLLWETDYEIPVLQLSMSVPSGSEQSGTPFSQWISKLGEIK